MTERTLPERLRHGECFRGRLCQEAADALDAKSALLAEAEKALEPFAIHDWMDAELEDDSCKLTKHSGPVTVGDWRRARAVLAKLKAAQSGEGK